MADIAINPVSRRVQFTGNGGAGPFAFTFNILADEDIAVYKNTTLLTLTTNYSVSTNADGTGSVTLTSAILPTDVLTIIGGRELERTTDFVTAGDLLASSLNEQLDSLVIMAQQLDEKLSRSVKVNPGDVFTDLELPGKDARKGTVLGFNATSGDPEAGPEIADVSSLAAITADISTLADIEDGTDATDAIQTAASISSDISTVSGISSDVSTVAGVQNNVGLVANSISNVNTVATNINKVDTVSTNISDVTTVAGDLNEAVSEINTVAFNLNGSNTIGTVATNIASVNTVATNIADVITVANDLNEAVSEVVTVADDLNEAVSEIDTVANSISNVDAVGTNISNVNTVAGISSDVTTVAGISANTTTVAGISANVTTVAGISSDVTAVAADATDIGTVAGISANVSTVAGLSSSVSTLALISSDITTVAGISANVTTVAGDTANIATIATNLNGTNTIGTVAGSISNVNSVGGAIADVSTVASNLTDVQAFANTYRIGATDPTTSLDEGDLFYNTTSNTLKVYTGSAWEQGVTAGSGFLPLTGGGLTGNLTFGDNNKAIFGASNPLEIYHDGTNKYIQDTGSGSLFIRGSDLVLEDDGGNDYITMSDTGTGGTVTLKHNASAKLATTSTGVDVTGNLNVSSTGGTTAIVEAPSGYNARVRISSGNAHSSFLEFADTDDSDVGEIVYDHTNNSMRFNTNAGERMRIDSSGRVGIGVTDPDSALEVQSSASGLNSVHLSNTSSTGYGAKFLGGGNTATRYIADFRDYNNVSAFKIDGDGNVGIGTSSPDTPLHIETSGNTGIKLKSSTTGTGYINFNDGVTAKGQLLYDHNGDYMRLYVNGAERMRIDSSGNVDIGSTGGGVKLAVAGAVGPQNGTAAAPTHTFYSDTNTGMFRATVDTLGFSTAGSEAMRITSSGNVGISSDDKQIYWGAGTTAIDASSANNRIRFFTSNSERMRIDSSGNLLVGTTSFTGTSGVSLSSTGYVYASSTNDVAIYGNRESTDGDIAVFRKDGTTVGSIGSSSIGGLEITGNNSSRSLLLTTNFMPANGSGAKNDGVIDLGVSDARWRDAHFSGTVNAANFNTTSDATLKTNVETLTGSLDAVKALRGVSFDWIENGNSEVGVIAQEVEAVVPDVVSTNDQGIKSVKYGNLVGVLIEAIKEQQAQIDELKAKLGD